MPNSLVVSHGSFDRSGVSAFASTLGLRTEAGTRQSSLDAPLVVSRVGRLENQGSFRFWTSWLYLMEIEPGESEKTPTFRAEGPTACPERYRPISDALEQAVRGYGSLSHQQGTVRILRGAAEEFKTGLKKDYRRALDRLLFKVSIQELGKREAVELLVPELVDAPSRELNAIFDATMALSDPSSVLDVALSEYDRTGRQRFLSLAVSVLEQSGKAAWPALRRLVRSTRPECELFIDAIVHCDGIAPTERKRVLGDLLRHPNSEVRARVNDALAELNSGKGQDALFVHVPSSAKAS